MPVLDDDDVGCRCVSGLQVLDHQEVFAVKGDIERPDFRRHCYRNSPPPAPASAGGSATPTQAPLVLSSLPRHSNGRKAGPERAPRPACDRHQLIPASAHCRRSETGAHRLRHDLTRSTDTPASDRQAPPPHSPQRTAFESGLDPGLPLRQRSLLKLKVRRNRSPRCSDGALRSTSPVPSGVMLYGNSMASRSPSRSTDPVPSAACQYRFPAPPARSELNTIRRPSGVHTGYRSSAGSNVNLVSYRAVRCPKSKCRFPGRGCRARYGRRQARYWRTGSSSLADPTVPLRPHH